MEAKDTSAQSGGGGAEAARRNTTAAARTGAAVPTAHSPPSLCPRPPNSGHSSRRGSRDRETQGYGRPPSKVARHCPALRVKGAEAPAGIRPARAGTPQLQAGGRGRGGERPAERMTDPGSAAASGFKLGCRWLLPGQDPLPTPLASPPGPLRSRTVAGNTSKSSRSRRERSLMARPVRCPVTARQCSPRLRR